jgi:outer membrane protein assembly factor BamB
VWRKSYRADLGGVPGRWAYSESPLVDGDRIICAPGGADATLAALNRATGNVVWKCAVPGGDAAAYASPIVVTVAGVRQVIAFLDKGVVGVDAGTGKFLWRFDRSAGNTNISTPVSRGDLIYSAGGRGAAALARIKADAGAFAAEAVYESRTLPNSIGGFVLIGDCLYGTTPQALVCVDLATGNVKWQDPSIGAGSVLCAEGRLYVHGENGAVALVEAAADGYKEKGRFTPPNPPERRGTKAWSYPVVANGKLYIRDLECLYCYDVKAPR